MRFTIFTPTYNRGYIIEKLYHSLQNQVFRDFEWIVIDDGSTDNTETLFEKFSEDNNDFNIIYKKVANGGKHRAINIGTKIAKGELFFIVDSDDFLPSDSLKVIDEVEKTIDEAEKKEFAGICGQKGGDSNAIGSTFDGEYIDATYLQTNEYNIHGDKSEVFYTDIIKKYPFPEFEGENFIPESTVWNKIGADGLKFRYFNKVVYYCDYLPDGLTKMDNKIKKYPKGYGLLLQQNIEYGRIKASKTNDAITDYYNELKGLNHITQIAKYLNISTIVLVKRIIISKALRIKKIIKKKIKNFILALKGN